MRKAILIAGLILGRPPARRFSLWGAIASSVAVASLVASAPAPAAVSCNFAAATAAITADAAGDGAAVGRDNSVPDNIDVNTPPFVNSPLIQCGGAATVNNTDTITFTDSSGSVTNLSVLLGLGPFAPGPDDEPGGSDEIELTASFGSGGNDFDRLQVAGCGGAPCASANDHIVWGSGGVNLNANEAPTVDADLTATGVEFYRGSGGNGNDTLAADGGFGTGIAALDPVELFGNAGMDFLTGGTQNDLLDGGLDNDVLLGGTGNDFIEDGPGDDQLDGEGGSFDVVSFLSAADGVSVDLAQAGAQDTGQGSDLILGVESIFGSGADDPLLSGSDVANNIQGADGDDTIRGLDGNDSLSGYLGDDVINGGADDSVVGDQIAGGDGTDTADYAGAAGVKVSLTKAGAQQTVGEGLDTLTDVENLAGSTVADTLMGDGAANVLKGRLGKDVLKAGDGADLVLSRDGDGDKVKCGPGHDVVKADAHDKLVGCEEKHMA